ncbi:MAG: hypothetical protein ACSHX9_10835 [Luteolibacter sp.]
MKPKLSEYLTILIALATIFACGCAIGYVLGKSTGKTSGTEPKNPPVAGISSEWQVSTLEKLDRSLALTPSQRGLVEAEISKVSGEISATKKQALHDYYQHLLDLHDRIQPHLDAAQRKRMDEDRKSLERLIDSQ